LPVKPTKNFEFDNYLKSIDNSENQQMAFKGDQYV
jgi:hypothetical protein